jgi:uncharacterized protein YndB with AHSA1/START domain
MVVGACGIAVLFGGKVGLGGAIARNPSSAGVFIGRAMEDRMDEPVVEVETTIDAEPARVWAAMTDTHSPLFMGATMETDWRPGSSYTLRGEWNGNSFTDYGEIETAEPNRELSFTHWSKTPERPESYNAVRLRIVPAGPGSRVTLAQLARGKAQSFDDKTRAEFRKNWSMMLEGLKGAVEGR